MKIPRLKMKKPLIIALIATVTTIGITAGVVFAQDDQDTSPPVGPQQGALLDKVAQIYEENTGVALDTQALKDAFIQAGEELRAEALDNNLAKLVEQGVITQEQADQFKEWWQAKPDTLPERPFFRGGWGGHFGPGGMGMGPGMGFPGRPCLPGNTTQS
jgi:hypothetical protein